LLFCPSPFVEAFCFLFVFSYVVSYSVSRHTSPEGRVLSSFSVRSYAYTGSLVLTKVSRIAFSGAIFFPLVGIKLVRGP
jgi:hypothetical protein